MTRHAKKTHQQFYESGERHRLPSTPSTSRGEAARSSRKERSVSDPGPSQISRISPDCHHFRPLVSPNGFVADFQRLDTADTLDTSSSLSNMVKEKDSFISNEDCTDPLYIPPPLLPNSSIKSRADQMFTIPEKAQNAAKVYVTPTDVVISSPHLQTLLVKQNHDPVHKKFPTYPGFLPQRFEEEKKMDTFSEESSLSENAMKEFLEEKDKIDFDSFINEINEDMFEKKPIILSPVKAFCQVKDEPKSRPSSPAQRQLINFPPPESMEACNMPAAAKPKPVFLRTQSQDSLTRTKNPVLPSIHAEGTLVVPEPKQVRYCSQDPFSLDFDEEQHFAELKGSLFLPEEDNQAYFQPWNN